MKILKSKVLLPVIVITAFLFTFSANSGLLAQPGDKGPRDGMGPAEKLKFDDEQKQELKKLGDEHKEKMKSLEDDNRKLHDELFAFLKETSPDRTKADSLIALIAENNKKMNEAIYSHLTDIKNLCKTDEQRKLFGEFIDDFGKMHGPPQMQPPPPPPPPPEER
jgi:Spy/CpxP family protein refolding chaperone